MWQRSGCQRARIKPGEHEEQPSIRVPGPAAPRKMRARPHRLAQSAVVPRAMYAISMVKKGWRQANTDGIRADALFTTHAFMDSASQDTASEGETRCG